MSTNTDELHRYTVDGLGRLYSDGEQYWPSVSTVLSAREKPQALKNWEERTDDAEAFMTYSQNRGSVAHAKCLQELVPSDDRELWGADEQQSIDEITDNDNMDRWESDREWIQTAWSKVKRVLDIDHVIGVEEFVINPEVGYSGQYDLLYQDVDGDTVLGDIKTGKYVYEKNQLQSAAYAYAIPMPVDRAEILRMNPDMADWEVSRSTEWDRSLADLFDEFCDLRSQLGDERIDEILEAVERGDGLREDA